MPLNMKLLALVVAFFFAGTIAQAQENSTLPEGKIRYVVTHNWTKQLESLDYISKQRKERNAYMWGGSRSEWKNYTTLFITPSESKYEVSEEKVEDEEMGYSGRKEIYTIRRNFASGTIRDQIDVLGQTYVVEDSIRPQCWKIMNDLKEVTGHLCMNAFREDTIKEQRITVWFALDIPNSAGPERLFGLPGLILEVDVNEGAVTLIADKIELRKLTTEMNAPKKIKGKKITETGYQGVIQDHIVEKRKNEEPWFWGLRYL
jgi:GLPGLI family protein